MSKWTNKFMFSQSFNIYEKNVRIQFVIVVIIITIIIILFIFLEFGNEAKDGDDGWSSIGRMARREHQIWANLQILQKFRDLLWNFTWPQS